MRMQFPSSSKRRWAAAAAHPKVCAINETPSCPLPSCPSPEAVTNAKLVADTIPNDPTMRWTRCNRVNQSIYDFTLDTLNGHPVTLNKFKGNELLIVNVATFCAYTEHYLDFGPLLDKFQDLRVLAFPCNQFGLQEPGENHEILNGIRYVRPGNDFQLPQNVQMFAKVEVNGQKQNPLFEFLKQSCPPTVLDISKREQIYWNPIRINDITWNFEKFLIDREGIPRFRFHPTAWDKGQLLEQFMAELGGGQQVQGMGSQVVMGSQQQQGEGEMQ